MHLIFSYGPQSDGERGTGCTNRFLRNGGPLFHQFYLKSLHSWVGKEAGLVLQDSPDREVQKVKVRAHGRLDFLAYE